MMIKHSTRSSKGTSGRPAALLLLVLPALASAQPPGLPHIFSSGEPAAASEVNENFREVAPANVIHVSDGDELLTAVNPANDVYATHGAPASDNPYLIKLAPGVYDLGDTPLEMLRFVDIEGSGVNATEITSTVNSDTAGTVVGAGFAGLRLLEVRNEGAGTSVAVSIGSNEHMDIAHVEAHAEGTGDESRAISIDGASPTLEHVRVVAGGAGTAYGIYNRNGSPEVRDSDLYVGLGGSAVSVGMANVASTTTPGVLNPRVVNSSIRSIGDDPSGIVNDGLGMEVTGSGIEADGVSSSGETGIDNTGSPLETVTVKVRNSTITTPTDTGTAVRIVQGYDLSLAATQLGGETSINATSEFIELTCFAVYDENFTNSQPGPLTACPQ